MPAFRYKHGDKPLDGYTIQRGVGRGGFGEVYYAISDSGREVALKVIQGYEQIELRGVSQCMNLKSPHLVTIFDVRHNPEDIPFVIMEYVSGPSLRELCDQQPAGLGIQKAAFFLREIGKGLTYLHDCGIVHRDLKPGNIFYENGYVKIGDYGLSKAMSASQHSGQTVTVGTVHYMAPEIGLGKYDRSIDIYAMGAVLFEMITGQVPYLGASAGEILMKHMSSEPNVAAIEEPFATVIKKAMAKDPAQRYQTVQEMVEGVFGAAHVRESMSAYSPGDLSMVAGRVAGRVAVAVGGSSGPPMPPIPKEQPDSWQAAAFAERPNRVAGLATPPPLPMPQLPSPAPAQPAQYPAPVQIPGPVIQPDPMPQMQRNILAGVTVFVIALGAGAVAPAVEDGTFFSWMIFALLSMVGAVGGIIIGRRYLLPKVHPDAGGFVGRLSVSGPAALLGLILPLLAFAIVDHRGAELLGRTWMGLILPLAVLNWVKWTSPQRITRVSLVYALIAAGFGLLMVGISGGSAELGVAILAGVALASSVLFPWMPRMYALPASASPAAANSPIPTGLLNDLRAARPQPVADAPAQQRPLYAAPAPARLVPEYVPWIWRGGMALFIAMGPVLIAAAENSRGWQNEERGLARGFGAGFVVLGILCFFQSMRRRLSGGWSYLIKPLVLYACLQIILISAFMLGSANLRTEEELLGIFFIIFPAIMFLILLFVPSRPHRDSPRQSYAPFPATPPPLPTDVHPSPSSTPPPASSNAPMFAPPQPHSRPRIHTRPQKLRFLANFIGWALHTVTFVIAILVALDLPGFIASGLMDQRLAADMARNLGTNWAKLAHLQGYVLVYLGAFLATAFLMFARRSQGIAHMLRPIVAAVCFVGATYLLDAALPDSWVATTRTNTVQIDHAQSIANYFEAAQAKAGIVSLFVALAGLALLIWPAPQPRLAQANAQEEGVS